MDHLPDGVLQFILSHIKNARDVAICKCVSKRWKESMPYIKSLYFPRGTFDNLSGGDTSDDAVRRMVHFTQGLEELVVYCAFTRAGLMSWMSKCAPTLRHLELRMDNNSDTDARDSHLKLEYLDAARGLESLHLWGVTMTQCPKWNTFIRLQSFEIVGARLEDSAIAAALEACPNLTNLSMLACEGVRSLSINLPHLRRCRLDFYGLGNCSLKLTTPEIEYLEVQGCSLIKAHETKCLKYLSVANNSGKVYTVDFGSLSALEFLSMRGVQWSWDAVTKMLAWASEVKHLYMKVEFTGDFDALQPFPEIDLVKFFNNHPKLEKFNIHGAMFAALCQTNSLKSVDSGFSIPYLEEVVITVRSPLNAEQKMNTLESIVKYAKNLKRMVIRVLQMKSTHSSADDFFDEICRFKYMHRNIVNIE